MKNKTAKAHKMSKEEAEQKTYDNLRNDMEEIIIKYSKKMDIEAVHSAILSSISFDICMNFDMQTDEFAEICGEIFQDERDFVDGIEIEIAEEEAAKELIAKEAIKSDAEAIPAVLS